MAKLPRSINTSPVGTPSFASIQVAIPAGAGTPSNIGVTATNNPGSLTWTQDMLLKNGSMPKAADLTKVVAPDIRAKALELVK